ncbi:MAG: L,D-transpeptidase family protein [Nibricoccus sp.]
MKKIIYFALFVFAAIGLAWANWPTSALPRDTRADRLLIEKRKRRLSLLHEGRVVKAYTISLGRAPLGAKTRKGDNKTPEGIYRIVAHKADSAFHRALRLSYPEPKDSDQARLAGTDPGSDIMIHGMKNGAGLLGRTHRLIDWTAGCIAVTNSEIEQLFDVVPDGTFVEIQP